MTTKQESPTAPTIMAKGATSNGGGGRKTFPFVIHRMLSWAERDGFAHIVSWQPHGRAFRIHKQKEFMQSIMPDLFRQSKWSSFQRQLNLYGFKRITDNSSDKGAYYHESFLRGQPNLSRQIIRHRVKGTKRRVASNPGDNPDFYAMAPLSDNRSGGNNDPRSNEGGVQKDKTTATECQTHHCYDGHENHCSFESGLKQHYRTHHHHNQAQHVCFDDEAFAPPRTVTPSGSKSVSPYLQSQKMSETNSSSNQDSSSFFPKLSPVTSSSTTRRENEYNITSQPTSSNTYNDAFDDTDYILSNDSKHLFSSIEGERHLHGDEFDLMGFDFAIDSGTDFGVV